MGVEVALLDESLLQSLGEHHEHLAALQVGAVEHGIDRSRQRVLVGLVLSLVIEVVDGIAVGEHDGVVAPFAAQDVNKQTVAGAAGLAFVAVVGAHHLAHVPFLHQGFESGKIGFPKVAHGHGSIVGVAQRFRTAVYGVVLGAGVGLEVLVVVALHAEHRLYAQDGVQVGVFAAGLLSASPARVTEDVDVGAPEGELGVAGIIDHAHGHIEDVVVGTVPVGTGLVQPPVVRDLLEKNQWLKAAAMPMGCG